MRALASIAAALLGIWASAAIAAPMAAPGFEIAVVHRPGTIFGGVSADGEDLLLTDLASGRLLRYRDGAFVAFGPTLPHGVDVIGDPIGPYSVTRHGDRFLIAQGWTPQGSGASPYNHALLAIDEAGAIAVLRDDFWNPFAFAADSEAIYVVDAARNSVERLTDDGRSKTTLIVFPRLHQPESALSRLSPTEFARTAGEYLFDAVPTGIALQGGRVFVSLFGGFPFLAGSGRLVSLPLEGAVVPRLEADALNAPVGLAFLPQGLLVLEHGLFDVAEGFVPGTGRLLLVAEGGRRTVVLDGMTRPTAVLVRDDEIVVTEFAGTLIHLRPSGNGAAP